MLELIWPYALLLAPLPWLIRRLPPVNESPQAALWVPFFDNWKALHVAAMHAPANIKLLLLLLTWLGLVLGLARPTWIGAPVSLPSSARDLMIAVDISGSMQVEDMRLGQNRIRRIDAVKQVLGDFIERRRGDRLGLILFGSNAYLQAPLTFDTRTVQQYLQEAQLGFAGRETAIGDAIGLAVKRLRGRPAQDRVLILLTDGANTAGEVRPLAAAGLAADNNVRIHSIGIGADVMEVPGLLGGSFGARTVNPSADLDEQTLTQIAKLTGGRYFRARQPEELAQIYQLLDLMEAVDQEAVIFRPRSSLFHWPLGFAVASAMLLMLSQGFARRW